MKLAYRQQAPLFAGAIPSYGATDTRLTFKLVNSYAVIDKACQIAKEQLRQQQSPVTPELIEKTARKLIENRPRKIQDALVKNTREAYSSYSDEQLTWLLASKRLNDYKTALAQRDVQSIYSIGSTAWIIEQDKINRTALAGIPGIEEYLAGLVGSGIVQDMMSPAVA